MEKNIKKVLEILFKYHTDNTDKNPSTNIVPCLKEISLYLKKKGIDNFLQHYTTQKTKIKHANLIAFNPKLKGPFILFQGHIDTTPFSPPYCFEITSKTLKGRGAVDMKGPLAGIIYAFISLYKNPEILKYPPALLIAGDEEANYFIGIKRFLAKKFPPILFAINGEPTKLKIGTLLRGLLRYTLEKKGKIRHSAYPKGFYLIEEMIPIIQSIDNFLIKARKIKDKKFGKTIGVFTVLKSGTKENQLPDNFQASFNLRTVKNKRIYNKIFTSTVAKYINPAIKIKSFSFDPIEVNLPKKIDYNLKNAFKKSGISYKKTTVDFFTEASLMNQNDILTVVFGPGNPLLAHVEADKEIIKIDEILQYSEILQNIVKQFNK